MSSSKQAMSTRVERLKDLVLKKGNKGAAVESLQLVLIDLGYPLKADGIYGSNTEKAVAGLQRKHGLMVDGIFGPKTASLISNTYINTKLLTEADLIDAAKLLGCHVRAIKAAHEVESAGTGFFSNGKPKILFERHVMRRRLLVHKLDPTPYYTIAPDLVNIKSGGYVGGINEFDRLERAMQIDKISALESCSWGAYQIMGYHYKWLGYPSVEAMVNDAYESEAKHLNMFVKFIKADPRLHAAIIAEDWVTFARIYNGPGNVKVYSAKLKKAAERAFIM